LDKKCNGKIAVSEVLLDISEKANLKFRQVNKSIIVSEKIGNHSNEQRLEIIMQGVTITGKVTSSEENDGLPGVNVIVQGSVQGTVTDVEGNYNIEVPGEEAVLIFSSVGYVQEEVLVGNKTIIDLELVVDITALEEIIVVGYGTKKKSDITGAIASVTPEEFESQPLYRVTDALQGRAAGVSVSNYNGAPGGGVKIRVRGSNSLTGSSNPLIVVDGIYGISLESINTNDIASIEVLKDASSTSLYGSRGANGVILVTTKKGSSREPQVNIDAYYGIQSVTKKIDILDGAQFARELNKKRVVLGASDAFSAAEIADLEANGGTDWQDETYRQAVNQNYQLSMSGKEGKIGYFISGNYADQEGIIINSNYKRYTLRSNLDFDISKKLSVKFNIVGSRQEGHNNGSIASIGTPVIAALIFDPTKPVIDPDTGNPTNASNFGSISGSPISRALGNVTDVFTNEVNTNLRFRYDIIEGLSYTFTGGAQLSNGSSNNFLNSWGSSSGLVSASVSTFEQMTWQNTSMFEYAKNIDAHRFSVKAIYELQKFQFKGSSARGEDILTPSVGFDNLGLAVNQRISSSFSEREIQSFIGRIDYAYKDKYLITATARADGSSVFPEDNKYGVFPSVALGWRLSEENFISNLEVFSNLKLRASYGITGNQAVAAYSSLALLRTGINYPISGNALSIGVAPGRAANPNLKWEETAQTNFGLDIGFFEGRLNFIADYYKKNTIDALLDINVPRFTGQSTVLKNIGEVENKGFEFAVEGKIFAKRDFNWDVGFNISFNKTVVIDIGGEDAIFPGRSYGSGVSLAPAVILEVGEEVGNFQGLIYDGVYKSDEADEAADFGFVPGDAKFKDLNDDGIINSDDIGIMGNGQPDYFWGFNNTFTYKGFELNVFFNAVGGFDVWNLTRGYTFGGNADARDATTTEILNQWSPTNESSNISAYSATSREALQSSRWVEDGSFIRLNNISLGYYLPESLLSRTFIKGIKIYASAQNILMITDYSGYDPEINSGRNSDVDQSVDWGAYPNPRTITFGINAQF